MKVMVTTYLISPVLITVLHQKLDQATDMMVYCFTQKKECVPCPPYSRDEKLSFAVYTKQTGDIICIITRQLASYTISYRLPQAFATILC